MSQLPIPIGRQQEVLYLPAEGHTIVLGTAGSGKTTLAILRAAYLADSSTDHCGRTLLVTFNRALVTYLRHLRPPELHNVKVENYHTFARGYLNAQGKMKDNAILSTPDRRDYLIQEAVKNVSQGYEPHTFFKRPLAIFSDEIQWLQNHGIITLKDYKGADRVGRVQSRIDKNFRGPMFEIFQEYLSLRQNCGKLYDWDDLALHTHQEFQQDNSERYYRHIVIDEGQDFSPEMIRSLSAAIPTNGSLTFFGDVAQQIYGQRISWRSAGLKIQKVWNFKENYRNTKEIAQLGLSISKMPYFTDVPDMVEPTSPRAAGEVPTVIQCKRKEEEIELATKLATTNSTHQNVAILLYAITGVYQLYETS
jgi:superfamily I DNA/RNA helicase